MHALLRCLLFLLAPMRRLSRRWAGVEWLLGLNLTPAESSSVQSACTLSGRPLGAYCYWKLAQVAQVMAVRHLDQRATLALIARADATEYSKLDALAGDARGALLAIPHHGAFVFSIVALAERFRSQRPVLVFYETPEVNAANKIFDLLYARLFADPSSGVTILHNNRNGIATALRQLKQGAWVVVMPAVYREREDTYQVPFCGRSRNVMLGTAVLSRRTGAVVLPLLSDPSEVGMGFRTRFGTRIEAATPPAESAAARAATTLLEDYRRTVALFGQFEQFMHQRLVHWQYCRSHFLGDPAPPRLQPKELHSLSNLFLEDPRVHVNIKAPIMLD